jgi:hypothetical protein
MEIKLVTAPVKLDQVFVFKGRNCKVIRIYDSSFAYEYVNPSLADGRKKIVTFTYWQENSYKPKGVGQSTLRYDGYTPSWDSPEYYAKRVIKRAINQLNQHL